MAKREQVNKPESEQVTEEVVDMPAASTSTDREATLGLTDDILDEIDGLLEENASQFVAQYIQRGGE